MKSIKLSKKSFKLKRMKSKSKYSIYGRKKELVKLCNRLVSSYDQDKHLSILDNSLSYYTYSTVSHIVVVSIIIYKDRNELSQESVDIINCRNKSLSFIINDYITRRKKLRKNSCRLYTNIAIMYSSGDVFYYMNKNSLDDLIDLIFN